MLNRLITTLRKRGARGQVFPVQAAEATQAAELIAGLVAQRDELLEALKSAELAMSNHRFASEVLEYDSVVREMIRAAIARAEGGNA